MELTYVIAAVLGAIIIYCLYYLNEINANYWTKKGVPIVYKTNPFTILFIDILMFRKSMSQIFSDMYKNLEGKKFGGYYQLFRPAIMIRDTELANRIFIKDFTYFENRGPHFDIDNDLFAMSLGNLTGEKWKITRHKLTPTFTSGKLKIMFESIKQCSDEGVSYLKDKMGFEIEAKSLMVKFVVRIIGNVAFGLNVDTFNDKEQVENKFMKYIAEFFKPSFSFFFKYTLAGSYPKLQKLFKFKLLDEDANNFFSKIAKDIINYRKETGTRKNDFLQIMIDIKKKEQESLNNKSRNTPDYETIKEDIEDKELMDQLRNMPNPSNNLSLSTGEMFNDEFIAAQTFAFISGGGESTAATLSFVLLELAINQDVQKKAKKEINDILISHEFNYEAVKRMVYLEQIINETFRLHSATDSLTRYCTKDYTIPETDIILEKGSMVIIPTGSFQKDSQYFPDPEKFDPERFEDMENIPKGVFFPFGSGPRMCIAMRLAMLEMKIILTSLLSNFTIKLSKKTKLAIKTKKNAVLNKVEGGIWIEFEKKQLSCFIFKELYYVIEIKYICN